MNAARRALGLLRERGPRGLIGAARRRISAMPSPPGGDAARAVPEPVAVALAAPPDAAAAVAPPVRASEPPRPEPTPMDGVLAWLQQRDAFCVVQIGAYVGDTSNDPLYAFLRRTLPARPHARAVLVEPVGEYFAQLRDAYRDVPGVSLENVAIATSDGERDFYRLGVDPVEHGQPEWLAQLGSLRETRMTELWDRYEQQLLDHEGRIDDLKGFWLRHRRIERVRCCTLHRLLERHDLTNIDLLQIDAEGYDYEILRSLDFERVRPRFVNYERVLLHHDEPACRAMMAAAGYVLFDWGQDTLCVAVA